QWTRVFEGKDGWYCATENNPMFPLEGRPKTLALVRDSKEPKKGCRETFTVKLNDGKGEKTWSGCRNKEAKAFLATLGKECGRFFAVEGLALVLNGLQLRVQLQLSVGFLDSFYRPFPDSYSTA